MSFINLLYKLYNIDICKQIHVTPKERVLPTGQETVKIYEQYNQRK